MKTQTKINAAIIIAMIAGFAIVTVSDQDPTHYSESLKEKRYCDRLSSTEKTCYPYSNTTLGKKYSPDGWKEIPIFLPATTKHYQKGDYSCNKDGCNRII